MSDSVYKEIKLKQGQVLFREGEASKNVYLVKTGILVGVKNADNRIIKAGQFHARDFIGVVNILESKKYKESVIAEMDSVLVVLPADELRSVIGTSPEWINKLVNTIMSRLESGLDLLAEHKISDENSGEFSQEVEAKFRKLLKD